MRTLWRLVLASMLIMAAHQMHGWSKRMEVRERIHSAHTCATGLRFPQFWPCRDLHNVEGAIIPERNV